MAAAAMGSTELNAVLRGIQLALESRPKQHPWSLYRNFDSDDRASNPGDRESMIDIETLHHLIYVIVEREEVDVTRFWYLRGPRIYDAPESIVEYLRRFEGPLRQLQLTEFDGNRGGLQRTQSDGGRSSGQGNANQYANTCIRVFDDAPALAEREAFTAWMLDEHAPTDVGELYQQQLRIQDAVQTLHTWMEQLVGGDQVMRFASGETGLGLVASDTHDAPEHLANAIELMYARLSTHPRLHNVRSLEQYQRYVQRFEDLEKVVRNTLGSIGADFNGVEDQEAAKRSVRRLWSLFIDELWPPIGYLISIDTAIGPEARTVIDDRDNDLRKVKIVPGETDGFHEGVSELIQDLDRANLT